MGTSVASAATTPPRTRRTSTTLSRTACTSRRATPSTGSGPVRRTTTTAAASCGSEDANLQDVTPYCDVGLVVMDDAGEYHFMSVKNNAYSNRSQKGTIIVEDGVASTATTLAFIIGGVAVVGAGGAAALVWKKKSSSSGVASKCAPVHFSSRHPANDQTPGRKR